MFVIIMEDGICAIFHGNLNHLHMYNKNRGGGGTCFFSFLPLFCIYDSSKPNKFFHMLPSPAAQLNMFCSVHLTYILYVVYCTLCLFKMSTRVINIHVKAMRKEFSLSRGLPAAAK